MTVNALTHESAAAPVENTSDSRSLAIDAERLREGMLGETEARAFVDDLFEAARKQPSAELAQLISSLLSGPALKLATDSGQLLRGRLVQAQLELGFPWALEMAPEDLVLAHPRQSGHLFGRVWLGMFAIVSVLWNGGWAAATSGDFFRGSEPFPLFFFVGLLHAVFSGYATVKLRSRRLYRWLGALVLCGPLFSVVQMLRVQPQEQGETLLLGLIFAAPAMVTALTALGLSASMPRD